MLAELRTYVLGASGVSSLIGTRMFPVVLPQSVTYPAISYNQVSGIRDWSLCGPADWARIRVQVNCWSTTYSQARSLADAVRARLQGVQFNLTPAVMVGSIKLDNEFDDFEETAGQAGIYRVVQDYIVSHEED